MLSGENLSLLDLERFAILAKLSSIIMHFLVTLLIPMMGVLAEEIRQGSRVIAGEDANYKDYPYYGLVVYKSEVKSGVPKWFCGSSLISDYFFLTAAHCMKKYNQPNVYGILMGVHNNCKVHGYEIMLDVDSIFLPSGYTFTKLLTSDIALMKTKAKVVGYDKILLPRNPIYPNQQGTLIGFGSTVSPSLPGGPQYPCTLQQSPQKILAKDQCLHSSDKSFCGWGTKTNDSSACVGDSGGPWITKKVDPNGVTYEITGVVSASGADCLTSSGYVTSLTDVHEHLKWINGVIA